MGDNPSELEKGLGQVMNDFFDNLTLQKYPRECKVLDDFIARGATLIMVRDALRKKFGVTTKSLWLIGYVVNRINARKGD